MSGFRSKKGFTIIELLVVIAIIAVLAAIVLVNVTQYINSGKNASIKANLASIQTNGSVYFETNGGNYGIDGTTNFCTDNLYNNPATAIANIGETTTCNVSATFTAWCTCSTLKVTSAEPAGSTFCVDSTGNKKLTQTDCTTECPNTGACQ